MPYFDQEMMTNCPDWEDRAGCLEFIKNLCQRAGLLPQSLSIIPETQPVELYDMLSAGWGDDMQDLFETIDDAVSKFSSYSDVRCGRDFIIATDARGKHIVFVLSGEKLGIEAEASVLSLDPFVLVTHFNAVFVLTQSKTLAVLVEGNSGW